jgi:methylated-DNA-[protein]-cysteine S-methyltransferase
MNTTGFALFDTAIGVCGLAWGKAGVRGVALPESDRDATRARLQRRFPGLTEVEPPDEPPAEIRAAAAAITSLMSGRQADLSDVRLDLSDVPAFHARVYEVARGVGPGQTVTYGDIAVRLGDPGTARAVGQALGRNPFPIVVPCHRVLAAGGRTGGFSGSGGVRTKIRMLEIEGAPEFAPALFDV